ncbi:MAG: hypothetical protein ACK521_10670 [bacterium]
MGQLYIDGDPFSCKCSPNVGVGYQSAGDTCFESQQVTQSIDGINFDSNSIYSPI